MPTKARKPKLPFRASMHSRNVCKVEIDMVPNSKWEQWFLIRSDAHQDNPHCNRKLEELHLNQALERNAGIIDLGDLFCVMQGKYDPRKRLGDVLPQHNVPNYLDAVQDEAVDRYEKYAHNWITMGKGNHESSITNRCGVDLNRNLAARLNERTGSSICPMGYTQWVWFQFKASTRIYRRVFWGIHGYGGGGPVTHDMIQSQRQAAYVDADIKASGHVHRHWTSRTMRVGLSHHGEVKQRECLYLKTSTYKDEYGSGEDGFHIETGKDPRPLGGTWIRFTGRDNDIHTESMMAT